MTSRYTERDWQAIGWGNVPEERKLVSGSQDAFTTNAARVASAGQEEIAVKPPRKVEGLTPEELTRLGCLRPFS